MNDPVSGTGADFVFIAFDAGILPKGDVAGVRTRIEDALDQALKRIGH